MPLWEVDGAAGEYVPYPPNPTNEHEMVCWDSKAYQEIKHHNESDCDPFACATIVPKGWAHHMTR